MSEFPTTDHAEALNQKYRERSRAKRLGKKEETSSATLASEAAATEVLSAETKAANAAARASAAAEKRAYAALTKHVGTKSMADEERAELVRLAKKISWYRKKFPEKLAPLKLKDKYTKLVDAVTDYETIRELFDQVDPEPILTQFYQNGAEYIEQNAKKFNRNLDLSGYSQLVRAATTPGTAFYENAPVKDILKEMSCEVAEYFHANIWMRFIGANFAILQGINAQNRLVKTRVSERLAKEIQREAV